MLLRHAVTGDEDQSATGSAAAEALLLRLTRVNDADAGRLRKRSTGSTGSRAC